MSDPLPGAWSASVNCRWKGDMLSTDMFCTMAWGGKLAGPYNGVEGGTTTTDTLAETDLATAGVFQAVTVVSGTPDPVATQTKTIDEDVDTSVMPTLSFSGTAPPNRSASATRSVVSGSSKTASASAVQSTGSAPTGTSLSGAVVFAGGAAGVLAAALAL